MWRKYEGRVIMPLVVSPPWCLVCNKLYLYNLHTTRVQTLSKVENLWIERRYRIIVLFCDWFEMPGARDELLQTAQLKFLEQRLYIIIIKLMCLFFE